METRIFNLGKAMLLAILIISQSSCNKKQNESMNTTNRIVYNTDTFCMGADLSFTNQLEDNGAEYVDSGRIKDPFLIFKQHGCNLVRVRLWHTPAWTMGTGSKMYSDLYDVEKTIKGLKI